MYHRPISIETYNFLSGDMNVHGKKKNIRKMLKKKSERHSKDESWCEIGARFNILCIVFCISLSFQVLDKKGDCIVQRIAIVPDGSHLFWTVRAVSE